jgi:hypothetical protein
VRCAVILLLCSWAASSASAAPDPAGKPQVSESEAAVREAVSRFRAAVREGTYDALMPTLTAASGREIRERLDRKLPIFRVESLAGFFAEAVPRNRPDAAHPDPKAEPVFNVTLTDADHARLDVEPLLSFRHPVYMVREDGDWRIDLPLTLRRSREPRPKEEIISVCRQALRGIADDADLVETKHFLIFAHTGPVPAQTAAQLLEELYGNFQQVFPFNLGISPPEKPTAAGKSPSPDAPSLPAEPAGNARVVLSYSPGPDPYMVVFLFSYRQTYIKFAERHDPGGASSGGYATPPGYFVVWFSQVFRPTVRHEGTHLLMYRRMHLFGAPSWLAEGMADNMADPRDAANAERPLREKLLGGESLGLEPLLLKEKIGFGMDYQLSQSLVYFLRADHPKEWVELIAFCRKRSGRQPKECHAELLRLLGMTQSQLDEAWRKFVLDSKPADGR